MTKQPAQGITAEQYRAALALLAAQREAKKQMEQQAAKQLGLITTEKVLEHFSAAERIGLWNR